MRKSKAKLEQVPFSANGEFEMPLDAVRPSSLNDLMYAPIDPDDPGIRSLANSIRKFGQKDAVIISLDNFIISGHRRHAACRVAGLKSIRCKREPILSTDPVFLELLRECNRQRIKTTEEMAREEIISVNPEEARRALVEYRRQKEWTDRTGIYEINGEMHRAKITAAKQPFLDAILEVLRERKKFWPLTIRQVHYALLNRPPLIHASKPDSTYRNNRASYSALSNLATRGRLKGFIQWAAIHDPTRDGISWNIHPNPQPFLQKQLNGLLKGYYRNLQQSQPNHIEIVIEKSTVENIVESVAAEYCIDVTPERGQCSLPPRHVISERFKNSGKGKLILLILGDFDPDGEAIVNAFCKSMRDDFDIPLSKLEPRWVCLNHTQVRELELPPAMEAKDTSKNFEKFVDKYGSTDTYELEAVPPVQMQQVLRDAVEEVLDRAAFEAEVEQEEKDAAELEVIRKRMLAAIGPLANRN
jgi:hypothetical protein